MATVTVSEVEAVDRIAARLRHAAAPVAFRPALTAGEREAVFRLRARAVVERGWLPAAALPGGVERDRFDEGATLMAGWLGDELAAAARLVWPDAAAGSPLRAELGIALPNAGEVVHLDRVCVARERTDASGRLTIALLAVCWLAIRARGHARFSGIDSATVTRLYRRLGFGLTVIGEPRRYWGEERAPVLFDPLGADRIDADRLLARLPSGREEGSS